MKKLFFIFVLVFCVAAGFAETGYAGTQWGTHKQNLKIGDKIEPTNNELWESTEARRKLILNKPGIIYYHFVEDYLYGITYTLNKKDTKQIISKFKNEVDTIKVESSDLDEWIDYLSQQGMIDNKEDEEDINLATNKMIFEITAVYEFQGYKNQIKNGNAKVYIFDYNDDTRVFLFENIVEGYSFVSYIWHEQDF